MSATEGLIYQYQAKTDKFRGAQHLRQAKCDAHLNIGDACSRCKRIGLRCTISAPFKRENKRQRLYELEHETDSLRNRLVTESRQLGATETPQTEQHHNELDDSFHLEAVNTTRHRLLSTISPTQNLGLLPPATPSHTIYAPLNIKAPTTTPRTLDGVTVSASDINNIFELYFRDYAQFLPILDPKLSPDSCYQQCSLLFWTVIGTACRSYAQNPTLLSALTKSITCLALLSVTLTKSPLQRAQAFMLLVTWPLPDAVETNQQETNFVLAGLLLHLAQRSGLHVPAGSDEFFRAKMPNLPDIGIVRRSELWAHIVLIYQRCVPETPVGSGIANSSRSCLCKGFLARTSGDVSPEMSQFQARQQTLPSSLILRIKWQDLCVQCGSAVSENGIRNLTPDQDRSLSIIIRTYETQIKNLEYTAADDRLECSIAKLYIRSLYFLKQDHTSYLATFDKIQQVSRQVITNVDSLMHRASNPVSLPHHIVCALIFATYALLRVLKSAVPILHSEREEARASFFHALGLVKKLSIDNSDMCNNSVTYLTQLWNSSRAFKKADGSDQLSLRARSRLNGSHVVDAIVWWREEFDPHLKAQIQTLRNSALGEFCKVHSDHTEQDPMEPIQTGVQPDHIAPQDEQDQMPDFGDTSLFDFDYFMSADLSFSEGFFDFTGSNN
ncbi:hypothetical protein E4T38_01237 [Aureobasidium subglaciale]|nr:hypothetical protein E4T38_01237 [Aureobasidium subglaciale]KAI5230442.1 hypothetical protein E4T40_01238 [Aureobasidium subglaciale]KAI5233660.1 hypothetical protein E4T41_01236 [Aureobasidium subglaciale]KAI5267026.1 hypothetical protein E4T46_01236 [Aureobasidium subglaciale]